MRARFTVRANHHHILLQIPYEPETLPSVAVAESSEDWKGDVKALGVFEDAFEVKGKHHNSHLSLNLLCTSFAHAYVVSQVQIPEKGDSISSGMLVSSLL